MNIKRIKSDFRLRNFVLLIAVAILGSVLHVAAQAQAQSGEEIETLPDIRLLERLGTPNYETANRVIDEILKRGDRMLPRLMVLKGDQTLFWGSLARNPNAASFYYSPSADRQRNRRLLRSGQLVTSEVAALYLITAIFYQDLYISQSPYLCDFSAAPEKRKTANSSDNIKKAWISTETWYQKVKLNGIEAARADHDYPFKSGDVEFY